MQIDKELAQKLPELKFPSSNIIDIVASMRQALVLPEDAKTALTLIQGPGRHKAIYVHERSQEQNLLTALLQIACQKKIPHCVLPLSDPAATQRLLSDVCLKNQKLNKISGPLAICIEKGGLLILRRDNVPNNVLEGLNNFWSDDLGEQFQGHILHPKLQVILISEINAPQLSPAASGRFQHLLLHPKTIFPVVTLKTKESLPTDEVVIIDLAFKDNSEAQAQLAGSLKREEKTYAWIWQEGELALLRKKSAGPLHIIFQHASCAEDYLKELLIKQQLGQSLIANGEPLDLTSLQFSLAPSQSLTKSMPKLSEKNLLIVSAKQTIHAQKNLYFIDHEHQYQQLFSLAGVRTVEKKQEWVLTPGYLDYLTELAEKLAVIITAPLTSAQWYQLVTEPRIKNLWVLENVAIPEVFQDLFRFSESKPPLESPLQEPNLLPVGLADGGTQFVLVQDLNYAIDWFTQRNPESLKIFISSEHNAQDLFNQYDEKKQHSPGKLWQALQLEEREVILIGLEDHRELAQQLQHLWSDNPLVNIDGRLEKRNKGRLVILLQSSHCFPNWDFYQKSAYYLPAQQLSSQLFSCGVEEIFLKNLIKIQAYIQRKSVYSLACKQLQLTLDYSLFNQIIKLFRYAISIKKLSKADAMTHSLYYGLLIRLKNQLDENDYDDLIERIKKIFSLKDKSLTFLQGLTDEWQERYSAAKAALEAHPLVFLAGPTATGKSQLAVKLAEEKNYRIFGPLTLGPNTQFQDMLPLIRQWAGAQPSEQTLQLILFLDEVTLAGKNSLEWLNGALMGSLILPNGEHYVLTPQHGVLMAGNVNYVGRTLHRFIQNNALIIPFPVFSTRFLRRQVIRPILNRFLSRPFYLNQANLDLIEKSLLGLYKKTPLLEPGRGLDSRTLTAILAHFEAYLYVDKENKNTKTPWQALFHMACFHVVLNGLLPAHRDALSWHLNQKLGHPASYPRGVYSLYLDLEKLSRQQSQNNSAWVETNNVLKLAGFYLCNILVSRYWRKIHQKNPPGMGGVLVVGPTNTGKDYILKLVMAAVGYCADRNYYSFNAGPFVDIQDVKNKALIKSLILHIAEIDLWSSALIEGAFNDLLTGQALAGLYTTANGDEYQDRQTFSAALLSRLLLFRHGDYSLEELKILIQRQTKLKEAVLDQLIAVHTYFLGDGIASSRHALQAARLISEGLDFIPGCARAYADSLRLPAVKQVVSVNSSYRLAVIQAYLKIRYSSLQPLLGPENFPLSSRYDVGLRTLTLSKDLFNGHWERLSNDLLHSVLQLHLTFSLPEEQSWLTPVLTVIHKVRLRSLLYRHYQKKPMMEPEAAWQLFFHLILSEKDLLDLSLFLGPHQKLLDLLTCIPQRLSLAAYAKTQKMAAKLWESYYQKVIRKMKLEAPSVEYQSILISEASGSGFDELLQKEKPLGKVQRFDGAYSGPLYFALAAKSLASQPLKFKGNKLQNFPLPLTDKMDSFDFKNPEFRITLQYCQSVSCGRDQGLQGFRLLVPQCMWPRVINEQNLLCQQDDYGFYVQIFSSTGEALTKIDEIQYDLFQIPFKTEAKKISVSHQKPNARLYFSAADLSLRGLMEEICQHHQSNMEKRLELLNDLLNYFTQQFSYINAETDQNAISQLNHIYTDNPSAQKITQWLLVRRKGVCFEFGVAFYVLCCDLFPDWSFELLNGYTEENDVIIGPRHVWVVLSLPGKALRILDPTPSGSIPLNDKLVQDSVPKPLDQKASPYYEQKIISSPKLSFFSRIKNEENWVMPFNNPFFDSNSRLLTTIHEQVFPLLQNNELQATQILYRDKPGILDYHLAARGAIQCFRVSRGLENHSFFPPIIITDYPRCPKPEALDSWVVDFHFWKQILEKGASLYLWTEKGAKKIKSALDLIKSLPFMKKPEEKALQDWQAQQIQKPIVFDQKKYQLIFRKLSKICNDLNEPVWGQRSIKENKISVGRSKKLPDKKEWSQKNISDRQLFLQEWEKNEKFRRPYLQFLERPLFRYGIVSLMINKLCLINQNLINDLAMISELNTLDFYSGHRYDSEELNCEKFIKIPSKFSMAKFVACKFNQETITNLFSHSAFSTIEFFNCNFDPNVFFPENDTITELFLIGDFEQIGVKKLSQLNKLIIEGMDSKDLINLNNFLLQLKRPFSFSLTNLHNDYNVDFHLDLTSNQIEEMELEKCPDLKLVVNGFSFCQLMAQFSEARFKQLTVVWENRSHFDLIEKIIEQKFVYSEESEVYQNQLQRLSLVAGVSADEFINLLLLSSQSGRFTLVNRYAALGIEQFVHEVNEALLSDLSEPSVPQC